MMAHWALQGLSFYEAGGPLDDANDPGYVGDPDENADDDEGDLCLDFIGEYNAPAAPDEDDEI